MADLYGISRQTMSGTRGFDLQREQEEFEARKRQRLMQQQLEPIQQRMAEIGLEKAERDLVSPQLPFQGTSWDAQVANEAYRFNLGKGMSEEQARQNAVDMVQRGKTDMRPVTDPYSGQTTFQPAPRMPIFEGGARPTAPNQPNYNLPIGSQPIAPSSAQAPSLPEYVTPINPEFSMEGGTPPIDPRAFASPDVNKGLAQEYGKQKINSIFENQQLSKAARDKQQQFEMKLNELIGAYGQLIERGDYKTELSENPTMSDLMRNLSASVQAGELGQKMGGAIGTSTATAIEGINTKQPMVFGELRELLGMTGREMDTQKERDFYMNIISKPSTEIGTTLEALNALSQRFGTGESGQRVQQLMQKVGTKKDIRSMSMQEKVQRLKELRAKAAQGAQ